MYKVTYLESVITIDIPALDPSVRFMIKKAIDEKLALDPIGFGKPLRYNLKGSRRLRVGDYRIVYRIDTQNNTVIIRAIQHRRDVYE